MNNPTQETHPPKQSEGFWAKLVSLLFWEHRSLSLGKVQLLVIALLLLGIAVVLISLHLTITHGVIAWVLLLIGVACIRFAPQLVQRWQEETKQSWYVKPTKELKRLEAVVGLSFSLLLFGLMWYLIASAM